jgi:hypothetical protein
MTKTKLLIADNFPHNSWGWCCAHRLTCEILTPKSPSSRMTICFFLFSLVWLIWWRKASLRFWLESRNWREIKLTPWRDYWIHFIRVIHTAMTRRDCTFNWVSVGMRKKTLRRSWALLHALKAEEYQFQDYRWVDDTSAIRIRFVSTQHAKSLRCRCVSLLKYYPICLESTNRISFSLASFFACCQTSNNIICSPQHVSVFSNFSNVFLWGSFSLPFSTDFITKIEFSSSFSHTRRGDVEDLWQRQI